MTTERPGLFEACMRYQKDMDTKWWRCGTLRRTLIVRIDMRRAISRLLLVALGGSVGACASPSAPARSLESHLQAFTGPSALSCGRLSKTATDQEMESALACALDAARRAVPFSVVREFQGVDSSVAEGLVARAAGQVLKFSFDSAPCGNSGRCSERFTTEPCPSPRLGKDSAGTRWVCAQ
jgi:hypothetical protein